MSGRRGIARVGGVLIALLAALCVVGPAAHGSGLMPRALPAGTSPASAMLIEDIDDHAKIAVEAGATRVRQVLTSLPAQLPVTVSMWTLLGATLLTLLAARGFVLSRAPDNPGRRQLITIGIDRR